LSFEVDLSFGVDALVFLGVGQSPFEFQEGAVGSQDAVVLAKKAL
jgi:hypothetical protein